MTKDFSDLQSEYENLWATMSISPEHAADVDAIARRLIKYRPRYEAVEKTTGVPWPVIAALHNRESDADFTTQLAQGDPLNRVSHNEPDGRGPFDTWEEGALDALVTLKHLDKVPDWTAARICYEVERYNGFGYRDFHPTVKSPYLWSFSNQYTKGKYVSDGRFDENTVDKQCGALPIIKRIMELRADVKPPAPTPEPAPAPKKPWWSVWLDMFSTQMPPRPAPTAHAAPLTLPERLVAAMKKHNYKLFTNPGETNIIYVKGMAPEGDKNDDAPNKFNDARFVVTFEDGKPVLAGAWQATVDPSRYWTEHRMNPKGAARVKPGQYTAWVNGKHHDQDAWVQSGDITVYRDDNEDFSSAGDAEDTSDDFGINQHGGYDLPKNDLGRSSAGCLVGRMMKGHREFMALTKADPRFKANKHFVVTAALLLASDV